MMIDWPLQVQSQARELDAARGEASRLSAAVQQQRLQLQGSVPAHIARQQVQGGGFAGCRPKGGF